MNITARRIVALFAAAVAAATLTLAASPSAAQAACPPSVRYCL